MSTYQAYEPGPPPESDLTQIEAYTRGLTNDPGCWVQEIPPPYDARRDPESVHYSETLAREMDWEERGDYERDLGSGWWPGMRDPDADGEIEAGQ